MTYIIHADTPEEIRAQVVASIMRERNAYDPAHRMLTKGEKMRATAVFSAMNRLLDLWQNITIKPNATDPTD